MHEEATHPTRHEMALRAARKWSAVPVEVVKTVTRCAPQYHLPYLARGWCFDITISYKEGRSGALLGRESDYHEGHR